MESAKIISGIKWTSIQFALDTLFRFSLKLILAKLLLPDEFGLVGMCTVFITMASAISELGMGAALIQKKDEEEAREMYSTAYWSGIVWGSSIYVFIAGISPFIADFFNEPKLIQLMPVLSLGIIVKPFGLIPIVILTRAMNFKQIAKIYNFSALLAGTIAILFAYLDFGVWALVINNVLAIILTIPLLFISTKWLPEWKWDKQHFKKVFGFGVFSTGTQLFSTLTYNIDNLLIGKMLGASLLGAYTLSFSLTEQLRQIISNIMNKVMYPVFGKNQENKEKVKKIFLNIIKFNAIIVYPIMMCLILFGKEIILRFFGEKWINTVAPLKILAMAIMVHMLVNSFASLIRGLGKPKLEMKIIMNITIFVLIPGLYFGIKFFGLTGAACAILLNKIILAVTAMIVLKREIQLSPLLILKAVWKVIFCIIICGLVTMVIFSFIETNNVLILVPVFVLQYLIGIYMLERKDIESVVKKIIKS